VGFGLKNMGSAQLDTRSFDPEAAPGIEQAASAARPLDLKQQAAERIRAHRERRNRPRPAEGTSSEQGTPQPHNPIAAAVAERFAHTPSYRAFLAEQAQRAMEQAKRDAENAAAEAEIAARNAQAVAQVQQQLLAELELWNAPQQFTPETAEVTGQAATQGPPRPNSGLVANSGERRRPRVAAAPTPTPVKQISTAGLTVRLYEDIGVKPRVADPAKANDAHDERDIEESLALDEEILFRQAPVFEPFDVDPPTPLPANLLEFPRQLVAARKARPRLAEGPLFEEPPRSPQLRIFEVDPEQISTAPTPPSVTPEWANIHLDAQPETKPHTAASQTVSQTESRPAEQGASQNGQALHEAASATPLLASMLAPQTAPLELRLMAAAVDFLMVGFAFVLFAGVTEHFAHRIPTGIPAAIAGAATFATLYPLYELLFFTLSDQTPGMRYARIGFCTLSDENPSRAAIRRRILAQLIAICPFGLGILWALLDEDGLGWHDRISKMYQRAY
jgi:uncharacterized RDD family membrane protein YckC